MFLCSPRWGASASRLSQATTEEQYRSIGEFGIGVISYFLVCDRFHLHTCKPKQSTIALEFNREMFDTQTTANEIPPRHRVCGTELILFVESSELVKLLIEKFQYWMRSVDGLTARKLPENELMPQGGLTKQVRSVPLETPDWIMNAELGPPSQFDVWAALDGQAHVDLLYHGVFVQRLEVRGLWAIEGALHVDPKHFKPNLNRESFVGDDFIQEITKFLNEVHPTILRAALSAVRDALAGDDARRWGIDKWVTLWLAVPRTPEYIDVAKEWDEEFWHHKTFRLLGAKEKDISLADLYAQEHEVIYVAKVANSNDHLVNAAIRVLRAKGLTVIRGIARDNGYLTFSLLSQNSTSESVLKFFSDRFPRIEYVTQKAEELLAQESIEVEMIAGPPRVQVVHLGENAAPVVRARNEIWINCDTPAGKALIREACTRNEGYAGLLIACQIHATAHVGDIAQVLRKLSGDQPVLGPVMRQYLRRLAQ